MYFFRTTCSTISTYISFRLDEVLIGDGIFFGDDLRFKIVGDVPCYLSVFNYDAPYLVGIDICDTTVGHGLNYTLEK